MLTSLSIRDIVLIEALDLEFGAGLSVLTGETGAGKSILLDSLSLAVGARADRALVRDGTALGRVIASFEVNPDHPACQFLTAEGIESDGGSLILRRQIIKDGRSKAWINDTPVGQVLLSAVGSLLVEIHGQHDDRGMMDSAGHRMMLDLFAGTEPQLKAYEMAWSQLKEARDQFEAAEKELVDARKDEDFLRHAVEELRHLAPVAGEEQDLADRRAGMMRGEKLSGDLQDFQSSLSVEGGADAAVRGVLRRIERLDADSQTFLSPVMVKDYLYFSPINIAEMQSLTLVDLSLPAPVLSRQRQ